MIEMGGHEKERFGPSRRFNESQKCGTRFATLAIRQCEVLDPIDRVARQNRDTVFTTVEWHGWTKHVVHAGPGRQFSREIQSAESLRLTVDLLQRNQVRDQPPE